ncbi:hypothetical protein EYF80_017650 [Liparis tanakae]|uniref:Uncharacterized protein n=1 Tax=Liparis tanakae TaxID=230148 RepID=A0A4Z2I4B2_9TELE|nr:hypothetical protein EYF80_017650 [Liparis tanakae]
MWRGGWHSSEKRRRRCMRPSALSWGLHSSCRGRPMILFTMFILSGFVRAKAALRAVEGAGETEAQEEFRGPKPVRAGPDRPPRQAFAKTRGPGSRQLDPGPI